MYRRTFVTLLGALASSPILAASPVINRVIVRNAALDQIKTLFSPAEIGEFIQHWSTRKRSPAAAYLFARLPDSVTQLIQLTSGDLICHPPQFGQRAVTSSFSGRSYGNRTGDRLSVCWQRIGAPCLGLLLTRQQREVLPLPHPSPHGSGPLSQCASLTTSNHMEYLLTQLLSWLSEERHRDRSG